MKRLRSIFTLLVFMALLATPAYSQGYSQYPNNSNQVPGLVEPEQSGYSGQQYGQMPPQYNQFQQGGVVPGLQQGSMYQPMPPQGGMAQQAMEQAMQQQAMQQGMPQYYQMTSQTQVPTEMQQQPNEQSLFQLDLDNQDPDKKAKKSKKSKASPYQQQEQALQEAQIAQQLEEMKQKKESEDSFKMSSKFDDRQPDDGSGGFGTTKKIGKGMATGVGKAMKTGIRYAAPAAGYVGSFFLLRAALGGNNGGSSMMMMPGRGGMYFMP
ncbi:MAG: hypothetical protein K2X93_09705 [Candidatus Obscuribacterales bacterium]|nr:hypothetical protein [Candidatus Obscuribacterales bacterium]